MTRRPLLAFTLLLAVAVARAQQGEDAPREEVLKRGTQLRLARERAVGLVKVEPAEGERPARARVSVSAGPYSLVAVLARGSRLLTGGAELEVTAVEEEAVRFARRTKGEPTDPLRDAPPPAEGGRLTLPELGLYRLPDGTVVGVGNVRPDGPGGGPVVTLTVFGPGYREDPAQGYDLHVDASPDVAMQEGQRRVRVHRVAAATADAPASVELELLPVR